MVVSVYVANKTTRAIVATSNARQPHSDSRVQQIMELLQGIRVVKFFCWEEAKAERVSQTRGVEMGFVRKQELLYALNRRAHAPRCAAQQRRTAALGGLGLHACT